MGKTLRVLLVEDNPGDADLIREMLAEEERGPFAVECAGLLSSATDLLRKSRFHAVLLDLGLPDSAGLETVHAVREEAPDLPIVVLTGRDDEETAIAAAKSGAQDYLVKGKTTGPVLARVILYAVERQKAEERIRESERFLLSSLNALSSGIAILDQTGQILFVNKSWDDFARENGGDPARVSVGVNYLTVCEHVQGPERQEALDFAAGIRAVVDGHDALFTMEYPCHAPNEQRWFCGRITPFPPDGAPRVVVAHENITDRVLAEKALRDSEERYRLLYQTMAQGAVFRDNKGHVLDANPAAQRILGVSLEEMRQERSDLGSWDAVREDGSPFPVDQRPCAVAFRSGANHPATVMGVWNPTEHKRRWLLVSAEPLPDAATGEVRHVFTTFEDITAFRDVERTLRETTSQLRRAQAVGRFGNWELDLRSQLVKASEEARNILGLGDRDWSLTEILEIALPKHRETLGEALNNLTEQGEPYDIRYVIRRPTDGALVDIHAIAEYDEDRRTVFGTIHDITRQMDTERALRETETRLRLALKSSQVGLWDWNVADRRLTLSPEWKSQLGWGPDEITDVYETWESRIHPDDREQVLTTLNDYLGGGREDYMVEHRLRHRDGSYRWILSRGEAITTREGRPAHILGCHVDITPTKQAEQAARESAARYRSLFEESPTPLWLTDYSRVKLQLTELRHRGVKDLRRHFSEHPEAFRECLEGIRILDVNDAVVRLHEAEGKAKLIEDFRQVLSEESTGPLQEVFARIAEGRTAFDLDMPLVTLKGGRRWLSLRWAAAPDCRKTLERVYVATTDMTERVGLEEQLRQAQKMEAVGQLAGGVAHDFNNILQAIMGYSTMLEAGMADREDLRECAREISQGARRAAALTRQLLAFSRRQVLRMEELDLNEIAAGLMKMLRRLIGENIRLDFTPGCRTDIVRADPGQMEQILMNLCVNARDAMPEGGRLSIEIENAEIDSDYCDLHPWSKPGKYVLLTVSDTGCGMDRQTQNRVFEPFFTTKGIGEGTGLGLATVHGIVTQHGGMIHVYSEVGKGTAFRVYLPLVEKPESEKSLPREEVAPGGTETILLVEDDEALRRLSEKVLSSVGYHTLVAADGVEALSLLAQSHENPDLVLTDVVMPGMGGRELRETLAPDRPNLKFLFTSGYSADFAHTNFILDEGIDLLQKPCPPSELLRAVRRVLDQE